MLCVGWGRCLANRLQDLSWETFHPQKKYEGLRSQPQWKRFLQFIAPTEPDIIARDLCKPSHENPCASWTRPVLILLIKSTKLMDENQTLTVFSFTVSVLLI